VQGPREPAPQARPPIPPLGCSQPEAAGHSPRPRRPPRWWLKGCGMLGDPVLALVVRLLVLLVVLVLLAAIVRRTRRR
jgi:hypothetical protein